MERVLYLEGQDTGLGALALVAVLALAVAWVGRYVCIRAQSGTHFDPRVAEAFLNLLEANGNCHQLPAAMVAGALRRPH